MSLMQNAASLQPHKPANWRYTTILRPRTCGNRILKAFANSLDPGEAPQNVASHQDPNSEATASVCLSVATTLR
ncbi:hypothetical protein DPMN_013343 [Dreissena polymorpha]|uniref:Uncharacterized protein n=1 Tax=Dreissena polymorpha TaxID=45954 RepID=A0A9D4S3L4_DREPO|nr:hypothetical protein DPMN_013343 [Dreissena polymorpha]